MGKVKSDRWKVRGRDAASQRKGKILRYPRILESFLKSPLSKKVKEDDTGT
jgi:hypothetical protein